MAGDEEEDLTPTIKAYLQAPKVISGRVLWRNKRHPDFSEVTLPVICTEMPEINGELRLTAHKTRVPPKYGFTLLVGSIRVVGLDVSPGRTHFNRKTLESVKSTHWQWFPSYEAESDERDLGHLEWLTEFCRMANIEFRSTYKSPPHSPVQLDLL